MKWNFFSKNNPKYNLKNNQDRQLYLIKNDEMVESSISEESEESLEFARPVETKYIKFDFSTLTTFDSVGTTMISGVILSNFDFKQKYFIVRKIYDMHRKGVFIIKDILTCKKYIMKIRLKEIDNHHELQVYNRLKNSPECDHIIKPLHYFDCGKYYYFLYDYYESENLLVFMKNNKLKKSEIRQIFHQILSGVKFIHSLDIIHCDLKLDNVLISPNKKVKIIDFDLSRICKGEIVADCVFGTPQYIAPESYDLCIYSKKSDIWALGIILYALITTKFPYHTGSQLENTHSNLCRRNKFKHPDFGEIDDQINNLELDERMGELLRGMLRFRDYERVNVGKLLDYNWIS